MKKKKKKKQKFRTGENFQYSRNVKSGKLKSDSHTAKTKFRREREREREMENNAMSILEAIKSSDVSFSLFPSFDLIFDVSVIPPWLDVAP